MQEEVENTRKRTPPPQKKQKVAQVLSDAAIAHKTGLQST